MIRKRGNRFSEKIMLEQQAKAKYRFSPKLFRFSETARNGVFVRLERASRNG
jgi:hypothetical protein